MPADLCTSEDREFFQQRIMPLLRLAKHVRLRKAFKYFEAGNVGFDEVLIEVRANTHKASPGWQGLSPKGLRDSNADSPDNVLSELTRIQAGKTPTCAYEYLLSIAEQVRIKSGTRPSTEGLIRDGNFMFEAEKKEGASGLMGREFEVNSERYEGEKKIREKGQGVFGPSGLVGLDGSALTSSPVTPPIVPENN